MNTYIIERTIPGAGSMSDDAWRSAATQSNQVIRDVGPGLAWITSYVTADKVFCIYEAEDTVLIDRHGECGGFPVDSVHQIRRQIGPSTAVC